MYNQIFGTITVVFCVVLYYKSYRYYRNDSVNLSLIFILVAGLALRFFVASDFFLHDWDERFHALVAKNMMSAPFKPMLYADPILAFDYKNWSSNNIWVHKQPFPLWVMAGSMKLFGVNEIALRLPSILLSTLAIFLTFKIGTFLFNRKVGLLAAFLHSINGLVIELTGGRIATDHIDVFFMCLIELAIFFGIISIKKKQANYHILTGIVMGLAILTKWLPALIVLPIWFLLAWNSRQYSSWCV